MNRRRLLSRAAALAALPVLPNPGAAETSATRRVRPSDPAWPSEASWEKLQRDTGGNLIQLQSPLVVCGSGSDNPSCAEVITDLKNPYYIGDQPSLTQSSGWVDAWASIPSVYAVAARRTADVVAAVNFARDNNLRLVIKGGGHSYQGTSNAADSLLIWTRAMNNIALHDAFVGQGCAGAQDPQPAVTIEAGAIWIDVYNAVTTVAGRYVQGGGCTTVGVGGLIQSGGFGSFSKNYGIAAAGLLEAEIVTADGAVRTTNACSHPDLFWAIKGGGGGSIGVVTKLTLRTRELPALFGGVFLTIKATSDPAFRRLIGQFVSFYADTLFNPQWGESVTFRPDNSLAITMVSEGLDKQQAERVWQPFLDWVAAAAQDIGVAATPIIGSIPARNWWAGRARNPCLVGGQSERNRDFLARLPIGLAARRTIEERSTGAPRRCSVYGQQTLACSIAFQQRIGGSAIRRGGGSQRHRNEPRGIGCVRTRDHCRRASRDLSEHSWPRSRSGRRPQERRQDRPIDGGTAEDSTGRWLLRLRDQFLRAILAAILLGSELPQTTGD